MLASRRASPAILLDLMLKVLAQLKARLEGAIRDQIAAEK